MKNIFAVDLRSLAFARISLGLLSLIDIGRKLDEITVFFSDSGILSRVDLIQNFELDWRMSLLSLNGSSEFAYGLAFLGICASILMILGFKTRVTTLIVWLTTVSFQARFPEGATAGGEALIRIFLFYSFFLPMNAAWSIDQINLSKRSSRFEYFSPFSALWIIQIFILYFFTFFYKWSPVYHTDFDAVWFMLQLEIFTTPLGQWLGQYYNATKVLSVVCYALEIIGPVILLIPWKRDTFRSIAVIAFWLFHLGIGLTMHLGNFVPICIIIWMGLIPSFWWDRLQSKISSISKSKFFHQLQFFKEVGSVGNIRDIYKKRNPFMDLEKVKFRLTAMEKLLGIFLLVLVVGWNIEGYVKERQWYIGTPLDEIMFTFQLQQGWAMFAPHPQRKDGWWVMDGVLRNGKKWDAFHNKEVTFERPSNIYATYPSDLWRKFLDNISGSRNEKYLLLLGRYLCRNWNATHQRNNQLMTFKLYFMQEWTQKPYVAQTPVEKITLWNHHCF